MPEPSPSRAALADLLRWYAEAGVDAVLDERPHDRLAEAAAAPRRRAERSAAADPAPMSPIGGLEAGSMEAHPLGAPPPPASEARPREPSFAAAMTADQAAVAAAQEAAAAGSLEALQAALQAFEGCSLKATATQLVFADGTPGAKLMLVGDAPGAEEDRQGKPFAGRAGALLDRMLAAIGLDRTQVYLANLVPWRPPGNRTPTPQETAICLPFIRRQIALASPAVLVCLGGGAAQALLGLKGGIMSVRGRWLDYPLDPDAEAARTVRAMATLHPENLLKQPLLKRNAWRDLRDIRRALEVSPDGA